MTHKEFSKKGGQSKSPKKLAALARNREKAIQAIKKKAAQNSNICMEYHTKEATRTDRP